MASVDAPALGPAAGPPSPDEAGAADAAPTPGDPRAAFRLSLRYFLGPLVPLLDDPEVSEIMVNGPAEIYAERGGRLTREPLAFAGEWALRAAAHNIAQYVGGTVDDARPLLDGRLPDGSRVCVVLSPVAGGGTSINIRRFRRDAAGPAFLLEREAITPQAMEFLELAVAGCQNLVVSGGTGSGKTTLLNVLSTAFDDAERIVVIEDTRELQVQKHHVVALEARPADPHGRGRITIRDLFVTSLRMRPDRIIVGEVRRGEALDMVQAMTSGHRGSLATLHASTPADACQRLETMALMADVGLPLHALRRQVASAIDLVVQTNRLHSGRRRITHISEIGYDEAAEGYTVHDLFNLKADPARLTWTGRRPAFADDVGWLGLAGRVNLTAEVFGEPSRGAGDA